jgi:hypothetical protein
MSPEESYKWQLAAFSAFSNEAMNKGNPAYIQRCVAFREEIDNKYHTSVRSALNTASEDSLMKALKEAIAKEEGKAKSFRDSRQIIGETSYQAPSCAIRRELGRRKPLRTGLSSPAPL